METCLFVENGDTLKALQSFLRKLLETGFVEALLVPMRTPGGTVIPALVTSPECLSASDPLAPVFPGNGAALASKLSSREPRAKVGAVLRACELRALVELSKMQQASLDDLILIAIDCAGTYRVPVFQKKGIGDMGQVVELWRELYRAVAEQPETPLQDLRAACKICEQPVYDGALISIKLLGSDTNQSISVSLPDELGEQLGLNVIKPPDERARMLERLVAARAAQRESEFAAIRARLEGDEGLAGVMAACIRCHNCMTVCPICYCKTCVFRSAIFDHEPMQYVNWARQKGAYRLPADTLLFHLTRLNHMVLSCVGCGMCTEACPADLPVGLVFRAIGERLQATFDYFPGRSLDDPLPLVNFKADEWTEVGE